MNNQDITKLLEQLTTVQRNYEAELEGNGGEITETVLGYEEEMQAIQDTLTGDGIDALGEWLCAKEDEKQRAKDRKAREDARIKSIDRCIDYIKFRIREVMERTGQAAYKGDYYGFTAYDSVTTTANKRAIAERFGDIAEKAVRAAGIPDYITVTLGASVKMVPEGIDLPEVFDRTDSETVKFNKPRRAIEKKED